MDLWNFIPLHLLLYHKHHTVLVLKALDERCLLWLAHWPALPQTTTFTSKLVGVVVSQRNSDLLGSGVLYLRINFLRGVFLPLLINWDLSRWLDVVGLRMNCVRSILVLILDVDVRFLEARSSEGCRW